MAVPLHRANGNPPGNGKGDGGVDRRLNRHVSMVLPSM
jgi:hypothetical protein